MIGDLFGDLMQILRDPATGLFHRGFEVNQRHHHPDSLQHHLRHELVKLER